MVQNEPADLQLNIYDKLKRDWVAMLCYAMIVKPSIAKLIQHELTAKNLFPK